MRSIFVSSTFRDMQSERDLLHTDIIPALNAYAEQNQDYLHFIDLRWGVNTNELDSDESAHKVLNVCLDEIDKSQPYMLIFIGDRYGWIPDRKYIVDVAGRKSFELDDTERSVTALEIEYGLLSHAEQSNNCVICIRNPLDLSKMDANSRDDFICEDEVHWQLLDSLKSKLQSNFADKIIYYDADWDQENQKLIGLDKLRDQILQRFLDMFTAQWEQSEELNTPAKVNRSALHRLVLQNETSAGNDAFVELIANEVFGKERQLVYLKGTPGSGKTTLLCQAGAMLKERDCLVAPFFCSYDENSSSLHDLLAYMVWILEVELELEEHNESESSSVNFLQKYLTHLAAVYEERDKSALVFLIDDLHKLSNEGLPLMFFLPDHPGSKVKFIMTCPDDFELDIVSGYQDRSEELYIYGLAYPVQARLMIYNLLERNHKELDIEVVDTIVDQGDCYNPLYISLLVNRLLMMDSGDLRSANNAAELTAQMIRIIEEFPEKTDEAAYAYLQAVGRKIAPEIADHVYALLAVAPDGLREHDLERIFELNALPWSTIDFTRLMRYLRPFVNHKDSGFVSFGNDVAAVSIIDSRRSDINLYYTYLLDYLKSLGPGDGLRQLSGLRIAFLLSDGSFIADELIAEEHNPNSAACKARKLISILREGGSDFLDRTIVSFSSAERFRDLASFFCEVFYPLIDSTENDRRLGSQIFSTLAAVAEEKFSDRQDQTNWLGFTTFAGIYNRLAALLDKADHRLSIHVLIKAADYSREELVEQPSIRSLNNYLVVQYKIASVLYADDDYYQAIAVLEASLGMIDKYVFDNGLDDSVNEEYARSIVFIEGGSNILLSSAALRTDQLELAWLYAISGYQKLQMVYRQLGNNESLDALAKALINYVDVAEASGKPAELVLKLIREIVDCYRELYRRANRIDDLRMSLIYMNRLVEQGDGGAFDEPLALEAIQLSEALYEKTNDLSDLKRAYYLSFRLAVFYYRNKRWQEAYDKMLVSVKMAEIYIRAAAELDANTISQIAEFNRQLSVLLNEFEKMEPAIHYAGRAADLYGMVWSQTKTDDAQISFDYALAIGCLAEDQAKIGNYEVSRELFLRQLEVFEYLVERHPAAECSEKLINCLRNLFVVHMKLEEEEQAWVYRKRAEVLME